MYQTGMVSGPPPSPVATLSTPDVHPARNSSRSARLMRSDMPSPSLDPAPRKVGNETARRLGPGGIRGIGVPISGIVEGRFSFQRYGALGAAASRRPGPAEVAMTPAELRALS